MALCAFAFGCSRRKENAVHVVAADLELCQGYGNCVMNAPGVFELDETGIVTVLTSHVDDADLERVRSAVAACPVSALSLRSA